MDGEPFKLVKRGLFYDHFKPRGGDLYLTQTDPPNLGKINLEGQEVFINKESKVIILELREVFRKAGIIFKWNDELGWQAFGLNASILRLVELTKSKLLINFHSNQSKKEYWINYDELRSFIENHKCMKRINGVKIYNVPLTLFKPKPTFSGA